MHMPEGFSAPSDLPAARRRMLLVFDGGNAPGYSSAAVALVEEGERRGYEMWAATEGFRSLTSDRVAEPAFERLIVSRKDRYALLARGIPARSMGRRVLDAGCDFRSERYRGFLNRERRLEAAATFREEGFTHVVCVGGDGTFSAACAWTEDLPDIPIGFVNVSIDNDIAGDRAIGFMTAIEAGATIARGLLEDAYTHKRVYILEMMGNRSGRHALHCGVAARAHVIVLPSMHFGEEVLAEMTLALQKTDYALVVVAEGYEAERRKRETPGMSAATFLLKQLETAGLRDAPDKRVIAEPFSRYLRGVRPQFVEVATAYLKATLLMEAFERGRSRVMPYVLAASDVGVRDFADVRREDAVEAEFMTLLDRLGMPAFQRQVVESSGKRVG